MGEQPFLRLSDKCWGMRKKAWAQLWHSGTTERTMLSFFKAFSGRFSKYLFCKTPLHAQKVNSQPKAPCPIHAGKNRTWCF